MDSIGNAAFAQESELVTELANVLLKHVVPLFKDSTAGKPELVGSSFLVSCPRSFYLISAAHVFDELRAGKQLYFYTGPNTRRTLSGELRTTKTPSGRDRTCDRLDVGVLKIGGPALPPHELVGKHPLPISALMANALPREGKQYLLVGFPASKSRVNPHQRLVTSKPFAFRNYSAPTTTYNQLDVRPRDHIVLDFCGKRAITQNGPVRQFPKPAGISGSPIWLLYDEHGPNDASQTPVVGVAIEHHREQHAMVATDIDIALKLINEHP